MDCEKSNDVQTLNQHAVALMSLLDKLEKSTPSIELLIARERFNRAFYWAAKHVSKNITKA